MKKATGYRKTLTGCWRCRERRVRCDEKKPACAPCRRLGLPCPGYQQNLVWVSSDQKTYRHNARRFLDPCYTWGDRAVLSPEELHDKVTRCDVEAENVQEQFSSLPFSLFRAWPTSSKSCDNNTVDSEASVDFEAIPASPTSNDVLVNRDMDIDTGFGIDDLVRADCIRVSQDESIEPDLLSESLQMKIPRSIGLWNRLSGTEAMLFNVYLTAVAPTLVPVHEDRNPWLRYPSIALHLSSQQGQNHLLHALMAQSAFCLSNIGYEQEQMSALGTRLYSSAMAELRGCLEEGSFDCLSLLTTILTLVLLELARGSSKSWRCHLRAALEFLKHDQNFEGRTSSLDEFYVRQSFHLLSTGCQSTGFIEDNPEDLKTISAPGEGDNTLGRELMGNPGYGWTMGTSSSVMETIAGIQSVAIQLERADSDDSSETIPLRLSSTLLEYQREVLCMEMEDMAGSSHLQQDPQDLHLRAFQAATLIYYQQTCERSTPRQVAHLVPIVLNLLSAFFEICRGCFTLWPLFVAAVEACTEDHQMRFLGLLDSVASVGMRDLSNLKALICRVWSIREETARAEEQDMIDTRVDWRKVMRDMELDMLIL